MAHFAKDVRDLNVVNRNGGEMMNKEDGYTDGYIRGLFRTKELIGAMIHEEIMRKKNGKTIKEANIGIGLLSRLDDQLQDLINETIRGWE